MNRQALAAQAICIMYKSRRGLQWAILEVTKDLMEDERTVVEARGARALASETIRRLNTIEFAMVQLVGASKSKLLPIKVRCLLHIGLFQILYSEENPARVTSTCISNIRSLGYEQHTRLANRALRDAEQLGLEDLIELARGVDLRGALTYNLPSWLINRIFFEFGDQSEDLLESLSNKPVKYARLNGLLADKEDLLRQLKDLDVEFSETEVPDAYEIISNYSKMISHGFRARGEIIVQDKCSCIPMTLSVDHDVRVAVDFCAAPGGKTVQMLERWRDQATIIAMDIEYDRTSKMHRRLKTLGASSAEVILGDAIRPPLRPVADFALADVPCSGVGTLGQRPDAKWRLTRRRLRRFPRKQLLIANSVLSHVRPSGTMIYSTCTILIAENQRVIQKLLAKNPRVETEMIEPIIGRTVPIPTKMPDGHETSEDTDSERLSKHSALLILPQDANAEGFFICKIRKPISGSAD